MVHITPPKLAALKLFDCLAAWLLVIFWILNALRWGGKRHGVHLQVQSQWRTLGSVRSFNKRCLHGPWVFPKNMKNMMVILPCRYNLMSFSFLYRNISCWSLPEIHVLWDFLHCSVLRQALRMPPSIATLLECQDGGRSQFFCSNLHLFAHFEPKMDD